MKVEPEDIKDILPEEKSKIGFYHSQRDEDKQHKHRLGVMTGPAAFVLIMLFALIFLPFFLFMVLFNQLYFWIRREKPINPRPYFHFDRHRIAHLSWPDRIWCEYCEWANGGLQWISDIVHEIERRYCPIQNQCTPHCPKAKMWREKFLDYDHDLDELKDFFKAGNYKTLSKTKEAEEKERDEA